MGSRDQWRGTIRTSQCSVSQSVIHLVSCDQLHETTHTRRYSVQLVSRSGRESGVFECLQCLDSQSMLWKRICRFVWYSFWKRIGHFIEKCRTFCQYWVEKMNSVVELEVWFGKVIHRRRVCTKNSPAIVDHSWDACSFADSFFSSSSLAYWCSHVVSCRHRGPSSNSYSVVWWSAWPCRTWPVSPFFALQSENVFLQLCKQLLFCDIDIVRLFW